MAKTLKNKKWKRKGMRTPKFEELVMQFPVFGFKVTVVISDDIKSASYYIADRDYLKEPLSGEGAEAFTVSSTPGGYAIVYLKPDAGMGTIAHESYHAVCAMLKMIGAQEEHEIVAYHLGFLVDAIAAFNLGVAGRFTCKIKTKSSKSMQRNSSTPFDSTDVPSNSSSSPLHT